MIENQKEKFASLKIPKMVCKFFMKRFIYNNFLMRFKQIFKNDQ